MPSVVCLYKCVTGWVHFSRHSARGKLHRPEIRGHSVVELILADNREIKRIIDGGCRRRRNSQVVKTGSRDIALRRACERRSAHVCKRNALCSRGFQHHTRKYMNSHVGAGNKGVVCRQHSSGVTAGELHPAAVTQDRTVVRLASSCGDAESIARDGAGWRCQQETTHCGRSKLDVDAGVYRTCSHGDGNERSY